MFLIKFFYFLKGYVIINLCGQSACELVSQCAGKGIKVYNITGGTGSGFSVFADDFYEVYAIANDMNIKLKVLKVCGLRCVLERYKKRVGFLAGLIMCILFFVVSSGFLWSIQVKSDGNTDSNAVLKALSEIGVKPGIRLKNMPEGRVLKQYLVNSLDNVAWAWVYVNGVCAEVHIHEGTVPPVLVDEDKTCDIVAAKDGFITGISTKEGKAMVAPGNGVNAGDVLISGRVEVGTDEEKRVYEVHADGEVMAITRYEETEQYSLWENRPNFTGNKKNIYHVNLFSKNMQVFSPPEYKYSVVTEKPLFSLSWLVIKQQTYLEAEQNKIQLPEEWVIEFAKRDLSARISAQLGKSSKLQGEEYTVVSRNNDYVTVKAELEFIEDIGVTVPG